MWKKMSCILVAAMAIMLCGCSGSQEPASTTLPPTTEAASTSESTTAPPEETTVPTYPAMVQENITYIEVVDTIPQFPEDADDTFMLEAEGNEHFSVSYIHTAVKTTGNRTPFDGQFFWVPRSEDDNKKSGNHYDVYIMADGALKQLENKRFFHEYTILGQTVSLELEYTVHGNELLLTYEQPENWSSHQAKVCDYSRGIQECLVRFQLLPKNNEEKFYCYFGVVNLETGEMTDIFSAFDPDAFIGADFQVQRWEDNGNLLVSGDSGNIWRYYDIGNGTFTKYDFKTLVPNKRAEYASLAFDGIFFWEKGAAWKLVFDGGTLIEVPNASRNCVGLPYYVYRETGVTYHVYNFMTGEDIAISDATAIKACTDSFVVYLDAEARLCIYDTKEKTVAKLRGELESWNNMIESTDGRKVLFWTFDKEQIIQVVAFFADTNTLIKLHRTNNNSFSSDMYIKWSNDDKLIIGSETYQDFCFYDFKTTLYKR